TAVDNADGVDAFSPRILNVHENRFVDRLQLTQQNGRLKIASAGPDVAITNTFAGGAVVLRRSFLLNEPYDEGYFVGFEDFDLALRAFTGWRPLRVDTLHNVTLVHKHMPVISKPDILSTRTRYNIPLIAKGFNILKMEYGDELFGQWEPWVTNQRQQMTAVQRIAPRMPRDETVRVTFVLDVPNWAFDNVVKNLQRHIGPNHVLTIVYAQQDDDVGQSLQRILESCAHIIHFMWRAEFRRLVGTAAVKRCALLMELSETEILDRLCQSH